MQIAIIYVDSKPIANSWTFARNEYPDMSDKQWDKMVHDAARLANSKTADNVYIKITDLIKI